MPTVIAFPEWLKAATVMDDPVGNFILDARRDPETPNLLTREAWENHLHSKGEAVVKLFRIVWRRYKRNTD